MFDRRITPRIRQRRRVGVRLSSGETVYTWTYDLSKGGIQIISEYSADKGDEFETFFTVYDPRVATYVEVNARVRVVHVVYAGELGGYRIGMMFVRFAHEDQAVYERFIDYRLHSLYKGTNLA